MHECMEPSYWKRSILSEVLWSPQDTCECGCCHSIACGKFFCGRVKETVARARDSLLIAQRLMSANADKGRRDEQFEVGEYVLLSTIFLKHVHVGRKKLLSKYLGPFEVLTKKGAVA